MIAFRRRTVLLGAGAAALSCGVRLSWAAGPVEIGMAARADGAHVYFDPVGIHVEPGATLRWTNLDARNSHTATAYHPANLDRPRRIPPSAEPWDSGYLLPGESFAVTLTVPGVYDYFCVPHEAAGMVGRIVVGDAVPDPAYPSGEDGLPAAALEALPSVDAILKQGAVGAGGHKEEGG